MDGLQIANLVLSTWPDLNKSWEYGVWRMEYGITENENMVDGKTMMVTDCHFKNISFFLKLWLIFCKTPKKFSHGGSFSMQIKHNCIFPGFAKHQLIFF
jgi:hypothetical protein